MEMLQSAAVRGHDLGALSVRISSPAKVWGTRMSESANWFSSRAAKPPDDWISASQHPAFRPQFEACDRLEEQVMRSISNPVGLYNNSENAVVKLAVSRALHTFDALLCLADAGYGAPALTL